MAYVDPRDLPIPGFGASDRPEFNLRLRLESGWWRFRMSYCQRDRSWYQDLATDEGETIVTGIRLVSGVSIYRPFNVDGMFPGELYVHDTTGRGEDPGLSSFRSTHRVYYRLAEVAAELAGTEYALT